MGYVIDWVCKIKKILDYRGPDSDPAESFNTILAASTGSFCLSQVSEDDVILAMSYFRCQAKGEDGIQQIVVTRALPIISPYLTRILNASLS